jgi:hypothetical protein
VGARIFTSPCRPDRPWGSPSLLSNGYRGFSPGVKRLKREADHSPPTSAEVKKNVGLYIQSTVRLHGVVLNQLSTGTALTLWHIRSKQELWSQQQPSVIRQRSVNNRETMFSAQSVPMAAHAKMEYVMPSGSNN